MSGTIAIRGDGLAALGCVHLLGQAGFQVRLEGPARPKMPAIMLSGATQKLLGDVFGGAELFDGLTPVRRRIVAWGPDAKPAALPHSAVVVSEQELLRRIRVREMPESTGAPIEWSIVTARPETQRTEEHHFGSRMARVAAVELKSSAASDACWIESLENGWLFLLPAGESAWLLYVGDSVETLLARSRLIAAQILEAHPREGCFASHPRIAESLAGPGWFACGSAALGFDPLCGEGAGHAIREAILACAGVRAILAGAAVNAVQAHYRNRLVAGFHRHLKICEDFYRSGGPGPWWQEQVAATRRGIDWCESLNFAAARSEYRLNGFSLEAVS